MSDNLHIDVRELGDVPSDFFNLKSPDRSKSWKGTRLKRSKTYSGSPSDKIRVMSNQNSLDSGGQDKVAPLSPVNSRKWNKTNMKRRSSNARMTKSFSEKHNPHILGMENCFSITTIKVSVKSASEISKLAVGHRYSCPCKQYLDTATGLLYVLDITDEYDSNIIEEANEDIPLDPFSRVLTSSPCTRIQTRAENTKAEIITSNLGSKFSFDFQKLDDSVAELLRVVEVDVEEDEGTEGERGSDHVTSGRAKKDSDHCDYLVSGLAPPNLYSSQYSMDDSGSTEISDTSALEQLGCYCSRDEGTVARPILRAMTDSDNQDVYVLIAIFSYLPLGSLCEASRVCRTWHCASRHPAVWRNVTVINRHLTAQAFKCLSLSCVSTENLVIWQCSLPYPNNEEIQEELTNFIETTSSSLKSLSLSNNKDSGKILDVASEHCSRVSHLSVQDCTLSDQQLSAIANTMTKLTCFHLGTTSGVNTTQFYDMESVKCLTLNGSSLKPHEITDIVGWFPSLEKVQVYNGCTLHSNHVKSMFPDDITKITFSDTYVTPRALLFILCSCKKLELLVINFSRAFCQSVGFEGRYRSAIREITEHPLFREVLRVRFDQLAPLKPPRKRRNSPL